MPPLPNPPPAGPGRSLSIQTILLAILLIFAGAFSCQADDVGLVTAKLTETADFHYVLEADVPPQLQNTLGTPSLPDGFKALPTELEKRGALVNVRYPFTGETALSPGQVILLPWTRNGVLVNVRWHDGSRSSHMFSSTISGIEIEIARLRTIEKPRSEAIRDGFLLGFGSVIRNWTLWIPVLCIALLFPSARAIRFLAMLAAGLTASLVILDIHTAGIPPHIALSVLMVAVILATRLPESRLAPVFAAAACILGLAGGATLPVEPRIAFVFGLSLFFLAGGGAVILLRHLLPLKRSLQPARIAVGALAFAAILISLLEQPETARADREPPAPMPSMAKSKATKAPRNLDNPFMVFVTIEPYEVRLEIMATGPAITRLLDFPSSSPDTIVVGEQAALKQQAIDEFAGRFTLTIDGQPAIQDVRRADFLTLGAAGAFTRTDAVDEPLEPAILGLTFTHPLTAPPRSLALTCGQLPVAGSDLPATILEPAGSTGFEFSTKQPTLNWQNQSDELRPSTIAAVGIRRPTWVPASLALLIAGLVLCAKSKPAAGYSCLAVALVATPFMRAPLPLVSQLPAEQAAEVTEHLLTNIYRSFDFRQESTIYDQLEVSVTGEQLTEIYLGQRRALELENRGGARARVENVEIESIESVTPDGDGVHVHARWNVSGSVNHFGHTHYRQNAYDAILRLKPVDRVWKISSIEVNDEKRIY